MKETPFLLTFFNLLKLSLIENLTVARNREDICAEKCTKKSYKIKIICYSYCKNETGWQDMRWQQCYAMLAVNCSVRLCCAKRQARRLFATRSARLQFEYYKVSCLYKISISLSNTYVYTSILSIIFCPDQYPNF